MERFKQVTTAQEREVALQALLASMDTWLNNDEGLMIEDVIEWRQMLAKALGAPDSWIIE